MTTTQNVWQNDMPDGEWNSITLFEPTGLSSDSINKPDAPWYFRFEDMQDNSHYYLWEYGRFQPLQADIDWSTCEFLNGPVGIMYFVLIDEADNYAPNLYSLSNGQATHIVKFDSGTTTVYLGENKGNSCFSASSYDESLNETVTYLYELQNSTLTQIELNVHPAQEILLLGNNTVNPFFLIRDTRDSYHLFPEPTDAENGEQTSTPTNAYLDYQDQQAGVVYLTCQDGYGNTAVLLEIKDGKIKNITPTGQTWTAIIYLGSLETTQYLAATDDVLSRSKIPNFYLFAWENGEWQQLTQTKQAVNFPNNAKVKTDEKFYFSSTDTYMGSTESLYQCEAGKITSIPLSPEVPKENRNGISFLCELNESLYFVQELSLVDSGESYHVYRLDSGTLQKINSDGLSFSSIQYQGKNDHKAILACQVGDEQHLYELKNGTLTQINPDAAIPAKFIGRLKGGVTCQSGATLYQRDWTGHWHDISPSPAEAGQITLMGSLGEQDVYFFDNEDAAQSKILTRSGKSYWRALMPTGSMWKQVSYLGDDTGQPVFAFRDDAQQVTLYQPDNSGSLESHAMPTGEWRDVACSDFGRGVFRFRDANNNNHLYQYVSGQWQEISPQGNWQAINFLGELNGKHYYQCKTIEGEEFQETVTSNLYERNGGNWTNLSAGKDPVENITFLGVFDGKQFVQLKDQNQLCDLFELDPANDSFEPILEPAGSQWRDIAFLGIHNRVPTFKFVDNAYQVQLQERRDGAWSPIQFPMSSEQTAVFVGQHGEKQYFRFQEGPQWSLYQRSGGEWQQLTPSEEWQNMALLGVMNDNPILAFQDYEGGYQLYCQVDDYLEPVPHLAGEWQHIAYLGSHGDTGYFRLRNIARNHTLYALTWGDWAPMVDRDDWTNIELLSKNDDSVDFKFREEAGMISLYEVEDDRAYPTEPPTGDWRNVRVIGERYGTMLYTFSDEAGNPQLYYRAYA